MVAFPSAGLLRAGWIRGAWTPPDCIRGPRPGLTVPQPLGPCCNLGEQVLLSGVPTVGLWGPEAGKLSRGSAPGLVPPQPLPSAQVTWGLQEPVGTAQWLVGDVPATAQPGRGGLSVGLPLSTGYLENRS